MLASGSEIAVPAPPADNSDQTRKELEELRQLQAQRDAVGNTAIQFYNAVPATQRWHDELDERIHRLQQLRDEFGECIGCGCLSIDRCVLANPYDELGRQGPGPRRLLQS